MDNDRERIRQLLIDELNHYTVQYRNIENILFKDGHDMDYDHIQVLKKEIKIYKCKATKTYNKIRAFD